MKKTNLEKATINRTIPGTICTVLVYDKATRAMAEIKAWKLDLETESEFLDRMSGSNGRAVEILDSVPETRVYSVGYVDMLMFGTYKIADSEEG